MQSQKDFTRFIESLRKGLSLKDFGQILTKPVNNFVDKMRLTFLNPRVGAGSEQFAYFMSNISSLKNQGLSYRSIS